MSMPGRQSAPRGIGRRRGFDTLRRLRASPGTKPEPGIRLTFLERGKGSILAAFLLRASEILLHLCRQGFVQRELSRGKLDIKTIFH
jgi:hypothetical protein